MEIVYGDHFLGYLKEAHQEMSEKEDKFIFDESGKLYQFSSDIELYEKMKMEIESLIGLLEVDEIRGATAINIFRDNISNGEYQDLFYRLVESGEYPKVWELYDFDERMK